MSYRCPNCAREVPWNRECACSITPGQLFFVLIVGIALFWIGTVLVVRLFT